MAKDEKTLSREEIIASVEKTLAPMESETKVKAWSFTYEKQHYIVLSFVSSRVNFIEVYESTRAGRKTSSTPLVSLPGCKDHMKGFYEAVEKLVPVESEVIS